MKRRKSTKLVPPRIIIKEKPEPPDHNHHHTPDISPGQMRLRELTIFVFLQDLFYPLAETKTRRAVEQRLILRRRSKLIQDLFHHIHTR